MAYHDHHHGDGPVESADSSRADAASVVRSAGIPEASRTPPMQTTSCATIEGMITGLAHTGVCVPDCEAAVAYYRDVLGFTVLSPPYVMDGDAIRADMGELLTDPAMKAAIVGFGADGDRVLEVIEYLRADGGDHNAKALQTAGCRTLGSSATTCSGPGNRLEDKGVRFLVDGIADIAGVRTTWFADPWGVVFILVEKGKPERPYFAQFG